MKKSVILALRIILFILLSLAGLLLVLVVYFSIVYSPEYVRRSFFVGEATVYDYLKLPGRPLTASPKVFHFATQPDEARVRAIFEANPKVGNLEDFLARTGTQAFIVIRNDTILYEKYFNGTKRDSTVVSFSTAKSFTSALVGIAISEGQIKSVDDPITDYLPELAARDERFQKITIHDLLGMASGIRYDDKRFLWHDESNLTYRYPDLRSLALNRTVIIEPPGQNFLYNDYNPILLGMILERATGRPVTDYLQEKLWTPLGMEFGGSWTLDSDSTGFEMMSCCINAHAIDFAKLGRLYLNKGDWDGNQVVPAEWVAESTQVDKGRKLDELVSYGNLWWEMPRSPEANDFFAWGNLGQFIYVSPSKNLIIVRNGEKYGLQGEGIEWAGIFHQFASDIAVE
jgi:CubicO group peptidase (beta-lactamase class C family)